MLYTLLDKSFITKGPDENYISYYTIAWYRHANCQCLEWSLINVIYSALATILGKKDYKPYNYLVNRRHPYSISPYGSNCIGIMIMGRYATVIYSSGKVSEAGIVNHVFAFVPSSGLLN